MPCVQPITGKPALEPVVRVSPMLGCGCSPNERKFSTPGGSTSGIVPTWRVENNRTASATRTPAPHARASRRACVTLQE
jgi:hypothetical protein